MIRRAGQLLRHGRASGRHVATVPPTLAPAARAADAAAARLVGARPLPQVPSQLQPLARRTAAPLHQAQALPSAFYTDESYVHAESERIFGTQWFAAAHTADMAKPGDVKVVDVAGTSIIITRDKKGQLNAFYNTCRHRGARICAASTADCKQLVCPYHWWAYRLDGSLKSTPPAAVPKARKEDLGLLRVPGLETFAGIIFLNQQPNPPPLADILGDLPAKLARYDLDDMGLHNVKDYQIRGDWKLIAENFVDFYHINAAHPELARFSRLDHHLPYQGQGQYVGFVTSPLTDCGGPGDSHNFNLFPRLGPAESEAALFFQIFPNVSVTIYPHSVYTLMNFPSQTPGLTTQRLSLLMAPRAKKDGSAGQYRAKCSALMDFVTRINDEAVVAIENRQRGLHNARVQGLQGEFLPHWPVHRFQNMVVSTVCGDTFDESLMPRLSNEFESRALAGSAA